jgi:hypothetical protein
MNREQFKKDYVSTRISFDLNMVNPGDAIKVYLVVSEHTEPEFQHMGLVESIDALRIKYLFYDWSETRVSNGYIIASDIPYNPQTDTWSETQPYKIFEVVPK